MELRSDVALVGGGIGGGALATVLARAGLDVVLVERQMTYRDRVRGEAVPNWGVAEIIALGLEEVLLGAGGGYSTTFVNYDEVLPTPLRVPIDQVLPGTAGFFNVGHPAACQALTDAAAGAGARVVRGVSDVAVTLRPAPEVSYVHDDIAHRVTPRIVVGADGRQSLVRQRLGRELVQGPVRLSFGGLLVDEVDWREDESALGTQDDLHFLVFPRPGGLVRLYLGAAVGSHPELAGPSAPSAFLDAFRFESLPGSESLAKGRPVGPCAFYPSFDTWVTRPYGRGAVLVGDAGGWTDPLVGQGISIALRDARLVGEVLTSSDDWSPDAFAAYGEERAERFRRLCVATMLTAELRCRFGPQYRDRRRAFFEAVGAGDQLAFAPVACAITGPESVPAEAFALDNIDRILELGAA